MVKGKAYEEKVDNCYVFYLFCCSTICDASNSVLEPSTSSHEKSETAENNTKDGTVIRYLNLRVMIGSTYTAQFANPYNKASTDLSYLHYPFAATWAISFTKSYVGISPLFVDSCPNSNGYACTHTDEDGCLNSTSIPYHHKNIIKNLTQITNSISSSGYDLFITLLCGPFCGNWSTHVPVAYGVTNYIGGKFAVVDQMPYTSDPNIHRVRIMQHEISHMFGCYDGLCSSGYACIMNGGYDSTSLYTTDIWCPACKTHFNPNAH